MTRVLILALVVALAVSTGLSLASQDGPSDKVHIRVWQSKWDFSVIYISARHDRGSWSDLGTIPISLDQETNWYVYGDITLDIPFREVLVRTSPVPDTPTQALGGAEEWTMYGATHGSSQGSEDSYSYGYERQVGDFQGLLGALQIACYGAGDDYELGVRVRMLRTLGRAGQEETVWIRVPEWDGSAARSETWQYGGWGWVITPPTDSRIFEFLRHPASSWLHLGTGDWRMSFSLAGVSGFMATLGDCSQIPVEFEHLSQDPHHQQ